MCHRGGRGQRVRLRAVSAFLNNGLPVCAMREWVNRYTVSFKYVATFCIIWNAVRSAASPPIIKERQYGFQNFVQCFPFETGGHLLKKHIKSKSRGIPCFCTDMERYFGCKPRSYLVY